MLEEVDFLFHIKLMKRQKSFKSEGSTAEIQKKNNENIHDLPDRSKLRQLFSMFVH